MYDVIIVGGGLSGLISARLLAGQGLSVFVIEKNKYPFHRVCGEYISNEVRTFLEHIDCYPSHVQPSQINTLQVTAPSGFTLHASLDMGGFGISRFNFDDFLKQQALKAGAQIQEGEQVIEIIQKDNFFEVHTHAHHLYTARLVIGAQGKRSLIDKTLERAFMNQRSPYIGVKYHIRTDHPSNLISLHNFKEGYCGISKIENDTFCLCYLTSRSNLREHGAIEEMEQKVLYKNPYLKHLFSASDFIYSKPEVINEISFSRKTLIEKGVLFSGDSAGMIAPLCGNGMAMAIHSAKLLSESILKHQSSMNSEKIFSDYKQKWNQHFRKRLWVGRTVQKLFGKNIVTEASLRTLDLFPSLTSLLISSTHGEEIPVHSL